MKAFVTKYVIVMYIFVHILFRESFNVNLNLYIKFRKEIFIKFYCLSTESFVIQTRLSRLNVTLNLILNDLLSKNLPFPLG